MAKRWSKSKLKAAAKELKKQGRTGDDGVKDSDVVHVNAQEKRMLKRYGGKGSTNPKTGLEEYKYGPDTNEGGNRGFKGGGSKTTAGGDKPSSQNVPTQSTGPTPPNDTFGSPESAAASQFGTGETTGGATTPDQAAPEKNLPKGVTPMSEPKPPGAVGYQEDADPLGVAATVLGGIGGGVARGLEQGFTGKDPLGDKMGKQTGWHVDSQFGGKEIGGPGTKPKELSPGTTAPGSGGPKSSTSSSDTVPPAVAAAAGGTITVNPDGTIRTQDTSPAGIRARRRYGAKTKPTAA